MTCSAEATCAEPTGATSHEIHPNYGNPKQMGGVPCIRGPRIPVATVVAMVADGMTETEILSAYPDLEREDVAEALRLRPTPCASTSCRW